MWFIWSLGQARTKLETLAKTTIKRQQHQTILNKRQKKKNNNEINPFQLNIQGTMVKK